MGSSANTVRVMRRGPDRTERVVAHVRALIERGAIRPGDRLPAERQLAAQIGVSRPSLRAALRALAAMGVVRSDRGSGTFIPHGPPTLSAAPLGFLSSLHGVTQEELFEARRILESEAAALAAARATADQRTALADTVTDLFTSLDDPDEFLVHDMNFHRLVAFASDNFVLASLVDMVVRLFYERRRPSAARATARNLADAARMHQRIHRAIQRRDAAAARTAMQEHLDRARAFQVEETTTRRRPRRRTTS